MIVNGWYDQAEHLKSPNYNQRPDESDICLLVIHNISLPPGEFGKNYVESFFLNKLPVFEHSYFEEIKDLTVSSHFYIKRDGKLIQFVSVEDRAWHAGESTYCVQNAGLNYANLIDQPQTIRENCNDFSVGIELEGTDDLAYSNEQYQCLSALTLELLKNYPRLTNKTIVGHCDIAPLRKTDPGPSFDWKRYFLSLNLD